MAQIDVSDILTDPDFLDNAVLIRRAQVIGQNGVASYSETRANITCCVQPLPHSVLQKFSDYALLTDGIDVYYRGELMSESPGGYADVIEWNGGRYQVKQVSEDFMTYGNGWTKAICIAEAINA